MPAGWGLKHAHLILEKEPPSSAGRPACHAERGAVHWLEELLTMPTQIDRDEVRRLLDSGAQLVEVLPSPEYEEEHLPGALHLPLRNIDARAADVLDRSRQVIVYCWDTS